MAIVSSHILDSVTGSHAAGIRCQLYILGAAEREMVFDVVADDEGRISETVDIDSSNRGSEFELVFQGADYFNARSVGTESMVKTVVIRFTMAEDKRYHLPVMLSPHSYSTWWSS